MGQLRLLYCLKRTVFPLYIMIWTVGINDVVGLFETDIFHFILMILNSLRRV